MEGEHTYWLSVSITVLFFVYDFVVFQFEFHVLRKITWVLIFFRAHYRYIATVWQDARCKYKRNIEARSRYHCCRQIKISITYSEYVCILSYPACKAHALYFIVIYGLFTSIIFLHCSS